MVFCNNCGAKNPDGSRFCSTCGSKMASLQPKEEEIKVQPGPMPTQPKEEIKIRENPPRIESESPTSVSDNEFQQPPTQPEPIKTVPVARTETKQIPKPGSITGLKIISGICLLLIILVYFVLEAQYGFTVYKLLSHLETVFDGALPSTFSVTLLFVSLILGVLSIYRPIFCAFGPMMCLVVVGSIAQRVDLVMIALAGIASFVGITTSVFEYMATHGVELWHE